MALEQHPVPQQISSYQFRLIGDMTLKQFFQLAAGAGIGLLIYGLPLPNILKWPLIIFFVLSGAAFAFLPVQDRPLSVWLVAFFRSIYSPTIFVWQRGSQEVYFAPESSETPSLSEQPPAAGDVASTFLGNLEDAEEKYLSKITGLFKHSEALPPENTQNNPQPEAHIVNSLPQPVPSVPTLNNQPAPTVQQQPAPLPSSPAPSVQPAPYYRPVPQPPAQMAPLAAPPPAPTGNISPFQSSVQSSPFGQSIYPAQFGNQDPFDSVSPDRPIFQNPEAVEQIAKVQKEDINDSPEKIIEQITKGAPSPVPPVAPVAITQNTVEIETPSQANILVGKVTDNQDNALANAIMEIKDEFGRPVRALKTDKDGKFRIVTPLHDGKYTIYTEVDNQDFDPIQLELQNTIVEPLFIQSKTK